MTTYNVRNVSYNERGTIDCEVEHATFGWLPFTACPDDVEEHSRAIYAAALAGVYGEIRPYIASAKSNEANVAEYTDFMQKYMDSIAKQRRYDGILALCTYATSTNPVFAAEGQAGVVFRDAVWDFGYKLFADVTSGIRELPSTEELLIMLPKMVWPENSDGTQ
ncbi:MAG: hypothetical protein H5U32_02730 [Pseudomonas balearica]|uniref:hypothetical protein n=1 Tax=Stutzerimonas balearica TaxID=74829 RepID=UPI0019858A57|nr:hypothetical protein [Stutzerimonas balearica]MBC7198143.1 hypothetical protein [Stutzerimonas balearica]